MDPHDIKAALGKKQVTQTDIARKFRISPTAVYLVVRGRGRSQKIENHIATVTGIPLWKLWPQWHVKPSAAA